MKNKLFCMIQGLALVLVLTMVAKQSMQPLDSDNPMRQNEVIGQDAAAMASTAKFNVKNTFYPGEFVVVKKAHKSVVGLVIEKEKTGKWVIQITPKMRQVRPVEMYVSTAEIGKQPDQTQFFDAM